MAVYIVDRSSFAIWQERDVQDINCRIQETPVECYFSSLMVWSHSLTQIYASLPSCPLRCLKPATPLRCNFSMGGMFGNQMEVVWLAAKPLLMEAKLAWFSQIMWTKVRSVYFFHSLRRQQPTQHCCIAAEAASAFLDSSVNCEFSKLLLWSFEGLSNANQWGWFFC